jgi:hypothetical protein
MSQPLSRPDKYHPTKTCVGCRKKLSKAGYSKRQWRNDQPRCQECAIESTESNAQAPPPTTKTCAQCKESREKDQFPKKQWKREDALCRVCFEMTKISDEISRICKGCRVDKHRNEYNIHQWEKGADALCHECRENLMGECLSSIGTSKIKHVEDGVCLCPHDKEFCDICMVDYTLMNDFARKRAELGRDLTDTENEAVTSDFMKAANIHINSKICIMDGLPVCPRSGRKLRCPCGEVTYCSTACQKHHWTIHKMTCKNHAQKIQGKKMKKITRPSHGLTEEELEYIRIEAFMAENSGLKHAIEECAHQLGEHPLVIGGGSIIYGPNGEEFQKGDVGKIYREMAGVEWDGSPRFGLGPYVQQKTSFDWIAKAKGGKSIKKDTLEQMMINMGMR